MVSPLGLVLALATGCLAQTVHPYSNIQSSTKGSIVDLGYSQYQGYVDPATSMDFWLGIRYAAAPVGILRWQAPVKPVTNRTAVIQANVYGGYCSQIDTTNATAVTTGGEDCLFLNVWKPSNATGTLPVIFWIHGGGYVTGNGQFDPTYWQSLTGQQFVFVTINYRLNAFGFLSSAELAQKGTANAGLLDQKLAMQWVQQYIGSFGGDPNNVTLFGESAGAGSVMQHILSYGGKIGNSLFERSMLASPFLPKQFAYNAPEPTKSYEELANALGCSYPTMNYNGVFDCMVQASYTKLAAAVAVVLRETLFGTSAFSPVVDGTFIQEEPSQQLLKGNVNGNSVLVGNNGDEGFGFTPSVNTSAQFDTYLRSFFPLFSNNTLALLKIYYPDPEYSNGLYTSQLTRLYQIYGDSVLVCPGNWIADAFTTSYRYRYSVPFPYHASDLPIYLPQLPTEVLPASNNPFNKVFDTMLGSFGTTGIPTIPNATFPTWSSNGVAYGVQADFNVTGATEIVTAGIAFSLGGTPVVKIDTNIEIDRCQFWRAVSGVTPA